MCTVCTINSGIGRVVIAAPDPPSGSLATERLAALPALWPKLAKGMQIVWAQSDDAGSRDSYLPAALRNELIDTFLNSRERLDSHLSQHGTLDLASLGEAVLAARQGALSASAATTLSLS